MRIVNKDTENEYIEASIFESIKLFLKGYVKISNISIFPNPSCDLEIDIKYDYDSIRKEISSC